MISGPPLKAEQTAGKKARRREARGGGRGAPV